MALLLVAVGTAVAAAEQAATRQPIVICNDGAWCWFQDERAVIRNGMLYVGSVACGRFDESRKGDVDVTSVDLQSLATDTRCLFRRLQADDHNAPAFWVRPDGSLLAVFTKHGPESHFYYTIKPHGSSDWTPVRRYSPSSSSRITYSNLLFLSEENGGRGRLYNFFRGLDASFKPSYAVSDDLGDSWVTGNVVIEVPTEFRHRPYVKYASNGRDTIHLLYTDGHPRNFDNSVYHAVYSGGVLHRSDGTPIRPLPEGLRTPEEGTCVFAGDPNNVAWVSDAHLSASGIPRVAFSVQKNSTGLASGAASAGQDHRYYLGQWDGASWQTREIAFGGSRLYRREDDYTGNICLRPQRTGKVFISTDVDPVSGKPLVSSADQQRHYEIFEGVATGDGSSWKWTALTENSTVDNLRPIVPEGDGPGTILLWFRGRYRTFQDYDTEIVMLKLP